MSTKKKELEILKTMVISSHKYGVITTLVSEENKIGNGYFILLRRAHATISGYVDVDGNEIISLDEMFLRELICTKDYQELCFGFEFPNVKYLKYYHVTNQHDSQVVFFSTNPNDPKPLLIHPIDQEDSLWFLEIANTVELENKYALYAPKIHKIITPFFSDLELVEENSFSHFAFFCSNIYTTNENQQEIFLTSLCGFINREGFFSSQILDTTSLELYSSCFLGDNPLSKRYFSFLQQLEEKYLLEIQQKEERSNQILEYLYTNPNLSYDMKNQSKKLAKIIPFLKKEK